VIILKEAPEIVYTGLKRVLGSPTEYIVAVTERKEYEMKIPLNETD
jgi:hypothetical protein